MVNIEVQVVFYVMWVNNINLLYITCYIHTQLHHQSTVYLDTMCCHLWLRWVSRDERSCTATSSEHSLFGLKLFSPQGEEVNGFKSANEHHRLKLSDSGFDITMVTSSALDDITCCDQLLHSDVNCFTSRWIEASCLWDDIITFGLYKEDYPSCHLPIKCCKSDISLSRLSHIWWKHYLFMRDFTESNWLIQNNREDVSCC